MGQPHRWQPGESGNPKGRTPGVRALTQILRAHGNGTIAVKGQDKKLSRKLVLADLLWQAVNLGVVTFPDGGMLKLDGKAWIECVCWLYHHVDGDAPQHVQVEDISRYETVAAGVRDAIVNGNGDHSSDS